MNKSWLSRWAEWAGTHPLRVFIVALVITLIMTVGVMMLRLEMSFYSIMPESSQQVADLKAIVEEFPFSSAIVVVVDARSVEHDAKSLVTEVIDEMERVFTGPEYAEWVEGVYGTLDVGYVREHGFMLSDLDDLERLSRLYEDPSLEIFLTRLNDDLEREYSGDAAALEADETSVVAWVHGLEAILGELAGGLGGSQVDDADLDSALESFLVGNPYYLSRDENMGLLFILPTFTVNDLGPLVNGTQTIDARVKQVAAEYGVEAGITGLTVVGKDEMVTSEKGFVEGMVVAFIAILILLIVVFRMRSTPIYIGIPLLVGVYWTMGLAGFTIHRLSILTAMYLVALIGLGADYAIHIMTAYVQERDAGRDYRTALGQALFKSGRGIVTGALTTAAAFIVLIVAESEMVKELAIIAATGILAELLAMLLLVPALLGNRARRYEKKGRTDPMMTKKRRIRSDFAGRIGSAVTARPVLFILLPGAVAVGLSIWVPRIEVEDNLMNMEAKGLESVELQDVMIEEFGAAPDVLYYRSTDPNELPELVDALDDLASVKYVDALTRWVPTISQQSERRPYLQAIRSSLQGWTAQPDVDPDTLLEELYRLEFNLVEMGDLAVLGGTDRVAFALNQATGLDVDGNKVAVSVFDHLFERLESSEIDSAILVEFQAKFSPLLAGRVFEMANPDEISIRDAPEIMRGTLVGSEPGVSLVTISPRQNPWSGRNRSIFTAQVGSVTGRSTGMVLAADELTAVAERDGMRALVAALIVVFVVLYVDFRNLKLTIISFLPLALAFGSLIGIMVLTGIKFDFINIIAIPLLVGIGIDNTVHINHRYLIEGRGRMRETLAGTGTAVLMTTLTTMIGFASFIPSIMRAMRSTGIVLTLAMAIAFTFAIVFHPSVLIVLSERWRWNLYPAWPGRKETSHE